MRVSGLAGEQAGRRAGGWAVGGRTARGGAARRGCLLERVQLAAPAPHVRCNPMHTGTAAMSGEPDAFPFAAIAMALNAALSTVLVSVPVLRRLLRATAGV